jgi:hypothetical protein
MVVFLGTFPEGSQFWLAFHAVDKNSIQGEILFPFAA